MPGGRHGGSRVEARCSGEKGFCPALTFPGPGVLSAPSALGGDFQREEPCGAQRSVCVAAMGKKKGLPERGVTAKGFPALCSIPILRGSLKFASHGPASG